MKHDGIKQNLMHCVKFKRSGKIILHLSDPIMHDDNRMHHRDNVNCRSIPELKKLYNKTKWIYQLLWYFDKQNIAKIKTHVQILFHLWEIKVPEFYTYWIFDLKDRAIITYGDSLIDIRFSYFEESYYIWKVWSAANDFIESMCDKNFKFYR